MNRTMSTIRKLWLSACMLVLGVNMGSARLFSPRLE